MSSSERDCAGLVALVTGASKGGTGTAIARRLAAAGAAVAITARDAEGLARTADTIRRDGGTVWSTVVDLSEPDGGRDRLVAAVTEQLGPVDILVNNAASNGYRPFTEWTPRRLEIAQQVNVWAPWRLMADVVPTMRERGEGWIVNITSAAAERPTGPPFSSGQVATGGSGYGATKAALDRLTAAVAAETYGQGIRVNAIAPQAAIATPHLVAAATIPTDLFEPMETMAEAVLALCSGPVDLTGRICRSLDLLVELDRPVTSLDGTMLVEGWQPTDLPAAIERQAAIHRARDERDGRAGRA